MPPQESTSILSLPSELLTKIAILASPSFASPTHGDKGPLAVLRLTCRLLFQVASPLFWNTVRIPGNAGRGSLGHYEAFARLFKMGEREGVPKPRAMVREMWYVVPDGTYQLSAALLGSFTALRTLHLEVARPDRHSVPFDSSLAEGLLDLPWLSELHLRGFTSLSSSIPFSISSLPNLLKLDLENCQSLDGMLGLERMVPHLKLTADAADRPIDSLLTPKQWDQVETLELGGATFADILSDPGALPKELVDSLVALGHPPEKLRHLQLDSFALAEGTRAEELFAALKGGPLISLRFTSLRSSSALKELSTVSALFPQVETLQIDDFDWTAETASFISFSPLLDNFTALRRLRFTSLPSSSPFPLDAELIAAAVDSTEMLRLEVLDAQGAMLFDLLRTSCEESFVVYE